jgi:hypothetical protein
MASSHQGDLFGNERPAPAEDDLETPVYHADPDKIRLELQGILAEMRAARTIPWDPKRTALYRTIFPQMSNWLPEEEGAQLRFEFMTELARLEAA